MKYLGQNPSRIYTQPRHVAKGAQGSPRASAMNRQFQHLHYGLWYHLWGRTFGWWKNVLQSRITFKSAFYYRQWLLLKIDFYQNIGNQLIKQWTWKVHDGMIKIWPYDDHDMFIWWSSYSFQLLRRHQMINSPLENWFVMRSRKSWEVCKVEKTKCLLLPSYIRSYNW